MQSYNVSRPLAIGIIGIAVIAIAFYIFCCQSGPNYDYQNPNRFIHNSNQQAVVLPKVTGKTVDVNEAIQAEVNVEDEALKEEDKLASQAANDDSDAASLGQPYEDQL
jgi:hypothetical protein